MTKDDISVFWERARKKLKENGQTVKSFAAASGISANTIYCQIQQSILPGVEEFLVLAAITNADPFWLLWGDHAPVLSSPVIAAYAAQREREGLEANLQELSKLSDQMQTLLSALDDAAKRS